MAALLLLTGCSGGTSDGSYEQITQEVVVLDVREQSEYDSVHIPGAILLPMGSIDEETAAAVIPEKDSTVLRYCRSGNRSKTASSTLAGLGYTTTPRGIHLRLCRFIQAEGAFALLKNNFGFRRFLTTGKANVRTEMFSRFGLQPEKAMDEEGTRTTSNSCV